MPVRSELEREAIVMLPPRLSGAIVRTLAFRCGGISEIRLRANGPLTVTVDGTEYRTGTLCTQDDLDYTVRSLSGNSLYSHAETIKEGYICSEGGIRAGVCGRAVIRDGGIEAVNYFSSINVRIPRRVPGAADRIFDLISELPFPYGVLIYSKPGVGKTTVLRELISRISTGDRARRMSVVDTRFELSAGIDGEGALVDFLSGYPRGKGIEIATRTLSPEIVMCDELSTVADADAVFNASTSGVSVIATCHGRSVEEIRKSSAVGALIRSGIFDVLIGLSGRECDGPGYLLEISRGDGL